MTNAAVSPRSVLSALRFRAEANPLGSAIDLVWELPLDPLDDGPNIVIVRRERRFPGSNRRGILPRLANEDSNNDLTDGEAVYDSRTFQFDFRETREERFNNIRIETTRYYDLIGERRERQLSRTASREFTQASNGIETLTRATIRLTNYQSIQPGIIYYYTAFVEIDTQGQFYFSSHTQASALTTGRYGHRLFTALPQIHQRLDTTYPASNRVTPGDRDKGQLQRFLEVFEAHADMLHGFVDGLRDLHNINRVDSQFLPHLAQYIGWHLQANHNEIQQRNELRNAPELYKTIGTIPTIKAIINRFTDWDVEVREFARSVLLTFDPSRLERLDNNMVYLDGSFSIVEQEPGGLTPEPWRSRSLPRGTLDTTDTEAMFKLRTRAIDDPTVYTFDAGRREFDLRLMTLDSVEALPTTGNGLVIVANINGFYHVRIFDRTGIKVIDTGREEFSLDEILVQQLELAFSSQSISEQTKSYLIQKITSSLGYIPNTSVLELDDTVFYNPKVVGLYFSPGLDGGIFSLQEETERIRKILAEFLPIQVRVIFFLRLLDVEEFYDATEEVIEEVDSPQLIQWRVFVTTNLTHRTIDTSTQPIDTRSRTWFPSLILES